MHYDRGFTWQEFFLVLYPVIVTEEKVEAYTPLIQMMQVASVGDPSPINAVRPAAPPRNTHLSRKFSEILRAP